MICSERESCNVEKLGCEGCFYRELTKEEMEQWIKDLIKENTELKTQRDYYKREYSLYNKTLEEAIKALTERGDEIFL